MLYFDGASTTNTTRKVRRAVNKGMKIFGNPSSLHKAGRKANEELIRARLKIAELLNCHPEEIYFTSGGTEANNWAIHSACEYGKSKNKMRIITSSIEHHSVLNVLKQKEKEGFEVIYLPVYETGIVKVADLKKYLTKDVCLVTIMAINNEIGTMQPIDEISALCKKKKVIFHTDGVQLLPMGDVDLKNGDKDISMMSASAHKFHGPKGVGFLFCRKGTPLAPFILGGSQERKERAGTENLPGIMGMAEALKETYKKHSTIKLASKLCNYRNLFIDVLTEFEFDKKYGYDCIVCGDKEDRIYNNVNVCFKNIDGATLQLFMDRMGVCVSVGAACTNQSMESSHVLKAIGVPDEFITGNLRITIPDDINNRKTRKFFKALIDSLNTLYVVPKKYLGETLDKVKKV